MTTYNGHKNWTHWNVSLWIGSDESIYCEAVRLLSVCRSTRAAARCLQAQLPARTPDGARYSLSAVMAALTGLR